MANPYVKQTWTDSVSQTTAARMGVMEQGIYDAHICPAARVYHNANQAIVTATVTTLAFNSERFDRDGLGTSTIHDNVTNNSRLTCRVAGIYQITANVAWEASGTGAQRLCAIRFNGGALIAQDGKATAATGIDFKHSVSTLYELAVNEYVEVAVYHDAGANRNVTIQANYSPEFMMVRVG